MCYYTKRSSLTWVVLHTEGKICSAMWCAVQYSQHITSITVFTSTCFIRKPFCNIDMTYSGEIFYVFCFKDSTSMTHAVFSPLFFEIKWARQRSEADGKVAEVEGWLGRKGWQQGSLKMCCSSVTWRRPCHSSFFCLITHLSLRYTARRQGCWQDSDTDRKRKRKEIVCHKQLNYPHSI